MENLQLQARIQVWARCLRWLTVLLAALGPLALVLLIRMGAVQSLLPLPEHMPLRLSGLSMAGWAAVVFLASLRGLGFVPLLWCLYQLFRAYEHGVVFSLRNIRLIKWCGLWLILIDFLRIGQSMLAGPLLSVTGSTPPFFIVSVGFSYSLIGLFVYLIAKIMELAQSMKEEQDLTI